MLIRKGYKKIYAYKVHTIWEKDEFYYQGFICADSFQEASTQIEDYFQNELESFSLNLIGAEPFIILDESCKDICAEFQKVVKEETIWQ